MRNRSWYIDILIFSFSILLSLIVTYPLIFKMKSHLYGLGGDSFASIWYFWWLKFSIWQEHISPRFCHLLSSPFGLGYEWAVGPRNIYFTHFAPLVVSFIDEISLFNLIILFSFPLSAVTMYYLVHHFTKNKPASMVSGLIYAFCPYHFFHAWHHLGLANIQWMPLYVLTLFKLDASKTYKNGFLTALAFSLVFLSDHYYGYFMIIFTMTFMVWKIWQGLRNKRLSGYQVIPEGSRQVGAYGAGRSSGERKDRSPITDYRSPFKTAKVVLVAILLALGFILLVTYPTVKKACITSQTELVTLYGYVRPLRDLFGNSARPLGYLLPSQDNPFFGKFTKRFIKSPFYGGHSVEHTLYLGWVGIVLSIVAIRNWRRKNKEQVRKWESEQVRKGETGKRGNGETGKGSRQAIKHQVSSIQDQGSRIQKGVSFFLFAGIVALIFSHSPYTEIGNFRILFPSYFMYKIVPMFRVYARFGIVVMLCVSVLAGIGLASILQKIRNTRRRRAFLSVVLLLIFIEFAPTLPAPMVNAVNPPPVYGWLTEQKGDFIIAEYPLEDDVEYLFWQRIHQKRLVNGALPGTYADKVKREIVDILKLETPGILSYLGTKYVILHPGKYLKSEDVPVIGEVPDVSKQKGLRLVKTFEEARVYEVVARPVRPKAEKAGKWAGE